MVASGRDNIAGPAAIAPPSEGMVMPEGDG